LNKVQELCARGVEAYSDTVSDTFDKHMLIGLRDFSLYFGFSWSVPTTELGYNRDDIVLVEVSQLPRGIPITTNNERV